METNKIIQLIKDYNPDMEHITLSTIYYLMGEIDGRRFHVINFSNSGSGKSQSSLTLIKKLKDPSVIFIDNTTTLKGLFQLFQNYPNQNILIDECSGLLADKKSQDLLKLVCV